MDPLLSFGGVDSASGLLTDVLGAFLRFLSTGAEKVVAAEAAACSAMLAFEFFRMWFDATLTGKAFARSLMTFLVAVGWYSVATNAVAVMAAYTSWMGSLGSFMSSGGINGDVMRNPSLFVTLGGKAFKATMEQAGQFNILLAAPMLLAFFIVGLVILACFIVLGIVAVFVVVKSTLQMILGLALLPFLIESNLRLLGARGLGLIVDAGLGLGAASLAIGVSYGFLSEIHLQPDATLRDAINLCSAALVLAVVSGGVAAIKPGAGMAIKALGQ